MAKGKFITSIASTATFILLEVAALSFVSSRESTQAIWVNSASSFCKATLWGWTEDLRYYASLRKTNEALAEENLILSEKLRKYQMAEALDTASLEVPETGFRALKASIVKVGRNSQQNYIILDKGYLDGVENGSGIVTSDGVVGVIESVSENYSYGITMQNTGLSISARLGHDGPVGSLIWDGVSNQGGILHNIPLHTDYHEADTVWTSGYSSFFPADIPLGIVRNETVIDGVTLDIEVSLFQDMGSLRFVKVLVNTSKDEISMLENMENQ